MSDPVTNVEIEDVLSSIRKLVSDQDKAQPVRVDALVLTPDHRVSEVAEAPQSDGIAGEDSVPDVKADPPSPEQTGRARDDISLAQSVDEQDAPLWPSELTGVAVAPGNSPDDTAPDTGPDQGMSTLERAISELEHAVAQTNDAWEPDGVEANDNDPQISEAVSAGWPPSEEENPEEENPDEDIISFPVKPRVLSAAEKVPSTDAVEWEDVEPDVGVTNPAQHSNSDPEPQDVAKETAGTADMAETEDAPTIEDAPTSEDAPAIEDGPAFVDPIPPFAPEADDEASLAAEDHDPEQLDDILEDPLAEGEIAIDEDMLRDLVTEIVRAELQGELGERITRNVRKLVRREIHRALTTQNLI